MLWWRKQPGLVGVLLFLTQGLFAAYYRYATTSRHIGSGGSSVEEDLVSSSTSCIPDTSVPLIHSNPTSPSKSSQKTYTNKEVAIHNHVKDCWIILHNKVYDVTSYLPEHPGGDLMILLTAGLDATDEFEDEAHSGFAYSMLSKYFIGDLETH